MVGKAVKKLIIVCDEKTEVYANYIRQLISAKDDKEDEVVGIADGTVDAAVWLEKDYLANKAQISSNEHILFVGDFKTSKSESSSMIIKYDKYGMKYGWLGKRAIMVVDNEMLSPEEYDDFIKYCLDYQTEFEKIIMKRPKVKTLEQNSDDTLKTTEGAETDKVDGVVDGNDTKRKVPEALVAAGAAAAGAVAGLGAIVPAAGAGLALGINKGINKIQVHKKVKDQQYRALSVILYIDGLSEFMEG